MDFSSHNPSQKTKMKISGYMKDNRPKYNPTREVGCPVIYFEHSFSIDTVIVYPYMESKQMTLSKRQRSPLPDLSPHGSRDSKDKTPQPFCGDPFRLRGQNGYLRDYSSCPRSGLLLPILFEDHFTRFQRRPSSPPTSSRDRIYPSSDETKR